MHVLVTGGAGYIGSHTCIELLNEGHDVTVVDNLSNSSVESLNRVEQITGKTINFLELDLCEKTKLEEVFQESDFDAVIHFAGLKAVGESVEQPLKYYRNNIDSTLALCEVMQEHGLKRLIFSSSATVYGSPEELPLKETSRVGVGVTNPYGWTKFMIEQVLRDIVQGDTEWTIDTLRYFNPIGAHESGLIGEDPSGTPNNLLPYISQVAIGKLEKLRIFGDDYDTPDGTGVRDYIHVVDLARGHVAALESQHQGLKTYNLGTGKGVSVFELMHAFESASGKVIPYEVVPRRAGDVAVCYADPSLAAKDLNWKAQKTLDQACVDSWRWQTENPHGYPR
ncbi:MAG TPA: UDP-glucose 4-epimerase GalE [Candidatus Microsaccharimonas sp.]|nr:UDP-glucose 4-epimerase GalE [Candidatus Microsaccharimonas sp.]